MRIERLRRLGVRGSVLLHVMLTSILVAMIAASLMRMALLRYSMGKRSVLILQEKRDDQGAMAAVIQAWNSAATSGNSNNACSATPAGWGNCNNVGSCNCTCTQPSTGVQVVAQCVAGGPPSLACPVAGTTCRLTIGAAHDIMP